MTIAAVGAVLLGHVGEAAALAFLFSLAEALEDRAMDRAKEGLRALLALIPDTVRVSRLNGDVTIPAADVRELDILVVGAGERVATDGVVVDGRSSIDTSAVTGESIPVEVGPGDPVPAGAVNGSGSLLVKATADGRDNSLTQIVALVEQAHARKGERARLADRIARPLVPVGARRGRRGRAVRFPRRRSVDVDRACPRRAGRRLPVRDGDRGAGDRDQRHRCGLEVRCRHQVRRGVRAARHDPHGRASTRPAPSPATSPQVVGGTYAAGGRRERMCSAWAAAVEATSTHPLATAITAATAPTPGGRWM